MTINALNAAASAIAGAILALSNPVEAAEWLIADGAALPVGSTAPFTPGQRKSTATTPDGRKVVVTFTDYDQWWLQKSDEEQAIWLDAWSALSPGIESVFPGMTFVGFMKQVMIAGVTLADIGAAKDEQDSKSVNPVLPDWVMTIAQMRCANYKAGMSFDEGREKADGQLPASVKEQVNRQLIAGSSDGRPTAIGLILLSVKTQAAVERVCGELSNKLIKNSAYN